MCKIMLHQVRLNKRPLWKINIQYKKSFFYISIYTEKRKFNRFLQKSHLGLCGLNWRGERKIKCIEQIKSKRSLPKAQKENKRVMNVCRFPGRPNQHRAEEQQSAVGIRMRRRQITIYFEIYFKTVNLHLFSLRLFSKQNTIWCNTDALFSIV